ncbi:MAG: twin-arginine translocase TatA/TatE family subunit [Planctomycetes bacterium]|nr:twin-arginine translocase TatA/TatE family subunit [Planctomycetota bacterium]
MTLLAFLNIGTFELLVVLVVAVMLFGGDLPDVARKTARMVGKVRGMAQDLGRELNRPDLGRHPDIRDVHDEIRDVDAAVRGLGRPAQRLPPPSDVTDQGVDPARDTVREERARREAGTASDATASDAGASDDASTEDAHVDAEPGEADEADRP